LRVLIVAFIKGSPPIMAIETARRAVPTHVRPTFQQVEQACKNRGANIAESIASSPGESAAA